MQEGKKMNECGCFWTTPVIKASGEVFPCTLIASLEGKRNELILGDLKKNSFSEIWAGKSVKKFREFSKERALDQHVDLCKNCIGSSCVPNNLSILSPEIKKLITLGKELPKKWLTIELSDVCNLKCIMCGINFIKKPTGFLDFEIFKNLVGDIIKEKLFFPHVQLHYEGESLMHPQISDILKLVNTFQKFFDTLIIDTNGHFMGDGILQELLKIEGLFLTFSIDAASKATYQKIRKGGNYDIMISNIKRFLKARANSIKNNLTRLQFIVQPLNEHEIKQFIEFWAKEFEKLGLEFSVLDTLSQFEKEIKPNQIYFKYLTTDGQKDSSVTGYSNFNEKRSKEYFKKILKDLGL
jgi:radical SAM protein with 4Fe4S-binding SPASM domain